MAEKENILALFNNTFNGAAWHGESLMSALGKIDKNKVHLRINNSASALELVVHMTFWRQYLINLLNGNMALAGDEMQGIHSVEKVNWDEALQGLQKSQQALLEGLEKFDFNKLPETIPERDYTWNALIHGVIHHDMYHLGQLQWLKNYT